MMEVTAEISMYPLQKEYIPAIDALIEKLNSFDNVRVQTFATATILLGEYVTVMAALEQTIAWSYESYGSSVFVMKIIPGYKPDV